MFRFVLSPKYKVNIFFPCTPGGVGLLFRGLWKALESRIGRGDNLLRTGEPGTFSHFRRAMGTVYTDFEIKHHA